MIKVRKLYIQVIWRWSQNPRIDDKSKEWEFLSRAVSGIQTRVSQIICTTTFNDTLFFFFFSHCSFISQFCNSLVATLSIQNSHLCEFLLLIFTILGFIFFTVWGTVYNRSNKNLSTEISCMSTLFQISTTAYFKLELLGKSIKLWV